MKFLKVILLYMIKILMLIITIAGVLFCGINLIVNLYEVSGMLIKYFMHSGKIHFETLNLISIGFDLMALLMLFPAILRRVRSVSEHINQLRFNNKSYRQGKYEERFYDYYSCDSDPDSQEEKNYNLNDLINEVKELYGQMPPDKWYKDATEQLNKLIQDSAISSTRYEYYNNLLYRMLKTDRELNTDYKKIILMGGFAEKKDCDQFIKAFHSFMDIKKELETDFRRLGHSNVKMGIFKYFDGIDVKNKKALHKRYIQLAKKLHADNGGSDEEFKRMQAEYEELFKSAV